MARQVTGVETLKALADPTRLAILTALMRDARPPRVMSVKELAAELGEPQTKLYRHVKQLEAAGLIRVAASRLVSGIIERRYQASQSSLTFGPEIVRDPRQSDDATAMVTAMLDRYRDRFFARRTAIGDHLPDDRPQDVMLLSSTTVSRETARQIRAKLQEAIDLLDQPVSADENPVPAEVLLGFFSPANL